MGTTLAELVDDVRDALGLTPQEAQMMVLRLVPTFEVASVTSTSPGTGGTNSASGAIWQAQVAAENSHNQLFNPASSGVLLLLDAMMVTHGLQADIQLARWDTVLATLGTAMVWDDWRRSGTPVGQLRRDTNIGALANGFGTFTQLVTTSPLIRFPQPYILPEGTGIMTIDMALNSELNTWFFWREERA